MKRPGRNYTFDAMVKFFIQYYQIPTKHDVEKLILRLDKLQEAMARMGALKEKKAPTQKKREIDIVLQAIERSKTGINVSTIQKKTGLEEKPVRNIIFRLLKEKKIARAARGIYHAFSKS
ncbi:MAG: hypothetical protein V1753_09280 [Pseudomonadota bacterium]